MTNSNSTPADREEKSLYNNLMRVIQVLDNIFVPGLKPFIKKRMEEVYGINWAREAREKLENGQQSRGERLKKHNFKENDLKWERQAVINLLLSKWKAFEVIFDEQSTRNYLYELAGVRNISAHPDDEDITKFDDDYTLRCLDTIERVLKAVPNDKTAREKAQEVRKLREDFSLPDKSTFAKPLAVNIQPDDNPFIPLTGRVETPQLFFGRKKEIQRVFETLNSGSSVAMIGDREIGKSSLLWAICQQAESQMTSPRKPIYINLQYILDDNDFYEALCYEVGIDVCKGYSLNRALRQQRPRLLLVLDEVEKMTWDGFTNQLRAQLRGLAEGGDAPLRLVVAASISLDKLFPDSQAMGMTSPFTNICIEERINAWNEARVREFISHRLASTQIRFEEDDIAQIVRESGGHPKRVMNICNTMYKMYKEDMS